MDRIYTKQKTSYPGYHPYRFHPVKIFIMKITLILLKRKYN